MHKLLFAFSKYGVNW